MFATNAEYYDAVYGPDVKDYAAEAARLTELIRARRPKARALLDVACGTGEHARHLAAAGFQVDGIDLEPRMIECARAKVPNGAFACGDMTAFRLERRYDVVVSLFSSVGYVRDQANLDRCLRAMADHLAPDGLLIVEPWFEPGQLRHGHVTCRTARTETATVCRMSRTVLAERRSRLEFEYLIGRPEGLHRASEVHELGMFTREEMEAAFRTAGLTVEYDPDGLTDRGLYLGYRDPTQPLRSQPVTDA